MWYSNILWDYGGMCMMMFMCLGRKGLVSNTHRNEIASDSGQPWQSICKVAIKWLLAFAFGIRRCLLTSKPHSLLIAGEGWEEGRVLDERWQLSRMWHLVSYRSRSAYHYTVLSFGQDVVSVCWKVYEKLAFQEELSPKFTPHMQILV